MAFWHDDAAIYAHSSMIAADGAGEIRARHELRFREPNLFRKLIWRVSVDEQAVDREIVTRSFPEGTGHVDVIAITK